MLDPNLSSGITYRWHDGSNLSTFAASTDGVYYVDVTNQCGQTNTDTIRIATAQSPFFTLGPDQEICPGDTIVLYAGADYAYMSWQDGSSDGTFSATQPGIYWLEVTTADGCSARDSVELTACTATSMGDLIDEFAFSIYPNPSSGPVMVKFEHIPMDGIQLEVFNGIGQRVMSSSADQGQSELNLDLGHLENGSYFLAVFSNGQRIGSKKLIIMQ